MCTRIMHLILFLAIVFLGGVALPQGTANAVSDKAKKEINANFDKTAKQLAQLLSNPGFRKFLSDETRGSRNSEKVLVLEKTLSKAKGRRDLGLPPGVLKKILTTVQSTKIKMKEVKFSDDFAKIDLYFPVESHRKKWRGEEKLLVAFAPLGDETKITSITAYRAKTAEQLSLDPNKAPDTPVLVIAAEEHESHKVMATPKLADPPPADRGANQAHNRIASAGDPENSQFRVRFLKIFEDRSTLR